MAEIAQKVDEGGVIPHYPLKKGIYSSQLSADKTFSKDIVTNGRTIHVGLCLSTEIVNKNTGQTGSKTGCMETAGRPFAPPYGE
ncbi:MAG: hypothetical protein BMS9Abin08_0629 [Gammaproteobacteria bacterium]|nr:MAG: hypothetical protein BMS9Abin08_0629 [Gammaproteobacteria bacterium]